MERIDRRPFGDDEDANRAIGSVLSLVGQLSSEGAKLGHRFRNIDAEHRQRAFVTDIRDRIFSVARRVAVDEHRFLEAARRELEKRTGRKIALPAITVAPGAQPVRDPEERRLADELTDAELFQTMLGEKRARLAKRLGELDEQIVNAGAAIRIAKVALVRHRAARETAR